MQILVHSAWISISWHEKVVLNDMTFSGKVSEYLLEIRCPLFDVVHNISIFTRTRTWKDVQSSQNSWIFFTRNYILWHLIRELRKTGKYRKFTFTIFIPGSRALIFYCKRHRNMQPLRVPGVQRLLLKRPLQSIRLRHVLDDDKSDRKCEVQSAFCFTGRITWHIFNQ